MNDTITSREELLLAKLAGRDVDISTMTPPVASNLSEKLMLEISDRLDQMETGGGGGGGDIMVVHGVYEDNGKYESVTITDHTLEEIYNAYSDGKYIILLFDYDGTVLQMPCYEADGWWDEDDGAMEYSAFFAVSMDGTTTDVEYKNELVGGINHSNKEIPEPDSYDNGKVIGVEGGEYSLVNVAKKYVVTLTSEEVYDKIQDETVTVWSTTHNGTPVTIAQIYAAKQAGKTIVAAVDDVSFPVELSCVICTMQLCVFSCVIDLGDNNITVNAVIGVTEENDDTWEKYTTYQPKIPSANSDANGKVLGVEDGEYALVDSGSPLIVTLTPVDASHAQFSESFADIYDAFSSGRLVFCRMGDYILWLSYIEHDIQHDTEHDTDYDVYFFSFIGADTDDKKPPMSVTGNSTGVNTLWFRIVRSQPILPDYSASVAGYILKVNASGTGVEWVAP